MARSIIEGAVCMKMFIEPPAIYLHKSPVDFRKSINGLSVARARCKFMDAKAVQPKGKTGRADQALNLIKKLYG